MTESSSIEAKPKKMVNRNVAVALGIICIVLGASLFGTVILLNSASLQNRDLQSQLVNDSYIFALDKSEVFAKNFSIRILGGEYWDTGCSWNCSGVLEIDVAPFNPNLWIQVGWSYLSALKFPAISAEVSYLSRGYMQNSTTYYYPVISSSAYIGETEVTIGNNSTAAITANVTILYYY